MGSNLRNSFPYEYIFKNQNMKVLDEKNCNILNKLFDER
jgi:hypothetical protein